MSFQVFDTKKQEEYTRQARERWGHTSAYAESEQRRRGRSQEAEAGLAAGLMSIFEAFGTILDTPPEGEQAQALVRKLQSYITQHYYNCTPQILGSLGRMYTTGDFSVNIDAAGGRGTADFASRAIAAYCK